MRRTKNSLEIKFNKVKRDYEDNFFNLNQSKIKYDDTKEQFDKINKKLIDICIVKSNFK
jgi:hypothetical protein